MMNWHLIALAGWGVVLLLAFYGITMLFIEALEKAIDINIPLLIYGLLFVVSQIIMSLIYYEKITNPQFLTVMAVFGWLLETQYLLLSIL